MLFTELILIQSMDTLSSSTFFSNFNFSSVTEKTVELIINYISQSYSSIVVRKYCILALKFITYFFWKYEKTVRKTCYLQFIKQPNGIGSDGVRSYLRHPGNKVSWDNENSMILKCDQLCALTRLKRLAELLNVFDFASSTFYGSRRFRLQESFQSLSKSSSFSSSSCPFNVAFARVLSPILDKGW